jgi:hypothetical protein
VPIDPDQLFSDAALDAAVSALADRNAHHLDAMTDEERDSALHHWRDLSMTVFTAARATIAADIDDPESLPIGGEVDDGNGRAVIVLEDSGADQFTVHAALFPPPIQVSDDELSGTPAQLIALTLLNSLEETDED